MGETLDSIVIKFGSGILTRPDGIELDDAQFDGLVSSVARLHSTGKRPIIVSSGAAAAGMMAFGIDNRPSNLSELQACCAVGQTRLMHFYETLFRQYGLNVAQLLLTNEDFATPNRRENVLNTMQQLLRHADVIPIVNENDSVAVEELKFGDNDALSASLSMLADASLLIMLTEVDGLSDSEGNLITEINDLEEAAKHVRPGTGAYSVGGMGTKLEAIRMVTEAGIPAIIANGRRHDQICDLVNGGGICSRTNFIK